MKENVVKGVVMLVRLCTHLSVYLQPHPVCSNVYGECLQLSVERTNKNQTDLQQDVGENGQERRLPARTPTSCSQ